MQQQILTMLEMQDAINSRVHPQWRSQGFEWYRAIWVEAAELLDHYGWKWWKQQSPDIEQVKLELVDIWHFGLSQLLVSDADQRRLVLHVLDGFSQAPPGSEFRADLENFVAHTLVRQGFDVKKFVTLLNLVGLGFDELYLRYVSKNVLNFFRQDNGYQEGTYIKIWDGREDNEHLVEVVVELDPALPEFRDHLYAALTARYQQLADL